jgi:hypothetical protein
MKFTDSDLAITEEEIADIEAGLGLKLPPPVRKLYLVSNGGVPDPYVFEDENISTAITELLPLRSEMSDTAPKVYECLVLDRGLVSRRLFPFAVEGGGDYFFVDTMSAQGAVYLYRHDTADPEPLISLRIGFDKFWASLKEE